MRPGCSTTNSLPVSSPACVSSTILSSSMPGKAGSSSTSASGRASTGGGSSRGRRGRRPALPRRRSGRARRQAPAPLGAALEAEPGEPGRARRQATAAQLESARKPAAGTPQARRGRGPGGVEIRQSWTTYNGAGADSNGDTLPSATLNLDMRSMWRRSTDSSVAAVRKHCW